MFGFFFRNRNSFENNLDILDEHIDSETNITRFVVLSKLASMKPTGKDKTSIVFNFNEDSPGSLFEVLKPFAIRKINLTKIESRPTRKQLGRYYFFIDIEGHAENLDMKDVLKEMVRLTSKVKILGSYPKVDYEL